MKARQVFYNIVARFDKSAGFKEWGIPGNSACIVGQKREGKWRIVHSQTESVRNLYLVEDREKRKVGRVA